MNKHKNDVLLTRLQCAEFLSITLPTLHKWVRDGILKAYQLGGRIYFKQHEVLKSLQRIKKPN